MRFAVWHTAALPLMKRFPSAKSFIEPQSGKKRSGAMTPDEIYAAMRGWMGSPPSQTKPAPSLQRSKPWLETR
jgi:hypothetical protein